MDVLTKEQRRKNMQHIKSKDTTIEIMLRKALWHKGLRYRKNYSEVLGKPDIVFKKAQIAIFCDSEFWHGTDWDYVSTRLGNNKYWFEKIKRNKEHDLDVTIKLRDEGWIVLRFTGKEITHNLDGCCDIIINTLHQRLNK